MIPLTTMLCQLSSRPEALILQGTQESLLKSQWDLFLHPTPHRLNTSSLNQVTEL